MHFQQHPLAALTGDEFRKKINHTSTAFVIPAPTFVSVNSGRNPERKNLDTVSESPWSFRLHPCHFASLPVISSRLLARNLSHQIDST